GTAITYCTSFLFSSISLNKGNKKACVFPEPVCDSPITLLLFNISGITFVCISVGSLKNNSSVTLTNESFNPNFENELLVIINTSLNNYHFMTALLNKCEWFCIFLCYNNINR